MNYIKKHWNGQYPLWVSFWINSILIYLLLGVPFSKLLSSPQVQQDQNLFLRILLYYQISILITSIWQYVGVYRSSKIYQEKTGNITLSNFSRIVVLSLLLGSIAVAYFILFNPDQILLAWQGKLFSS